VPLFETITNLTEGVEPLRRRSYGVIEAADGRLCRVVLRPFPKIVTLPGALLIGGWRHRRRSGDFIRLYYNRPRRFPNFLILKYAESTRNTSMKTLVRAMAALDEIGRLLDSDAALCDVSNRRISRRLLGRFGWTPHCPSWFHRHYIKRFRE
jgi:hypothetical protein